MMSPRRLRILLLTLAAVATAATVFVVIAAVTAPPPRPVADDQAKQRAKQGALDVAGTGTEAAGADVENGTISLEAFERLWDRNLRRPLYDPPPAEPAPPPPPPRPPAPPPLTLVGTVVEDHRSRALLAASDGRVRLLAVGERVDEVEVVSIAENRVVVRHGGRSFELEKPKEAR